MGWVPPEGADPGEGHEGFCVAVLGDGSEPPPAHQNTPTGTKSGISPHGSWTMYDGSDGRPRTVAVRAGCTCGWRSREMFPLVPGDKNATEAGSDGETGPLAAWQHHITRLMDGTVPADVREQIDALREAIARLAATRPLAAVAAAAQVERTGTACLQRVVAAATRTGRSWGEIGSAMGVTRQAAHSRFAKTSPRG